MELEIVVLVILTLSLFFLNLRMVWLSALLLFALAIYVFFRTTAKTISITKATGEALASGVKEEVREAEGAYPTASAWKETMHELGRKAGEQAFAQDRHRFTMRNWGEKLSRGLKQLVKAFKKMFGE